VLGSSVSLRNKSAILRFYRRVDPDPNTVLVVLSLWLPNAPLGQVFRSLFANEVKQVVLGPLILSSDT
jgi:hypothetical protein